MRQTLAGQEVVYPAFMPSPDHVLVRNIRTGERLRVQSVSMPAENMWTITLADAQPPGTEVEVTHGMLDTPDDAITFEMDGHPMLVMVLAGPGASFSVESVVGETPHPLVTAAISNPPSASGAVQCYLTPASFAECMRSKLPILRMQMPGLCVFPWRRDARSEAAQKYLEKVAGLLAMQLICGVTTLPSTRGLDVFPAIAWTLAADGNMQAALALAPYYTVLAERLKRGEQTVLECAWRHCDVWNGITLSNAEDGNHAVSNVPLSVMCPAFRVACVGGHYPHRIAPALFETARLGLAFVLTQKPHPEQFLRSVREAIVTPLGLCDRMQRAENIPAADVLTRLVPHLVDPNADIANLHFLVRCACRHVLREPFQLARDHPSVVAARDFLWALAEAETTRPLPTMQRPRETWALLITVMRRLATLLGPSSADAVVAAANDNSGWMRKVHCDAMMRDVEPLAQGGDALHQVLSPIEMVWLALVLCKTQGNTARIRELGPLAVRGGLMIDDEFVEAWAPDNAVAALGKTAMRDYYVELIDAALLRVRDPEIRLRPDVLLGLTKMTLRNGYTDQAVRMMDALSRMRAISSRANLTRAFFHCVPGKIVSTDEVALACVVRVLEAACTKPVPAAAAAAAAAAITKTPGELAQVLASVPTAILALHSVQNVFVQRGVNRDAIESLLGNPGVTTCIPGSRRFSTRLVKLLHVCANTSRATHVPWSKEVLCLSTTPHTEEGVTVVVVPSERVRGTIFDSPHDAARVYFKSQIRGGGLVPFRVVFEAAVPQVRDDDGHWSEEWISAMVRWRGEVLGDTEEAQAAKVAAKAEGKGKAPAAPAAPAAPVASAEELEEIVTSVELALGRLRAPQANEWDDGGDDDD